MGPRNGTEQSTNVSFKLTFWHSEKWYGEGDPIEEDGVSDDSVSPALSSRKINNSAVRPSAGTVSAKAECEQTVKSSPQPSRRLSRGANLLGLL